MYSAESEMISDGLVSSSRISIKEQLCILLLVLWMLNIYIIIFTSARKDGAQSIKQISYRSTHFMNF